MIEFLLKKIIESNKLVILVTKNDGSWVDYLFCHNGRYEVYNTGFTSDSVGAIVIAQDKIVIQLK